MKHIIAKFSVRVGEAEHYMQRLMKMKDDTEVEEAVHDTLHNWWGEETVTEDKGTHYHREWQESLKLEDYRELDEDQYELMSKYLMEW